MLRSRLWVYSLLVLIVIGLSAFAHFWISDRLGVLRTIYPVQALWSNPFIHCSENAPPWMREQLRDTVRHIATRGQLAHISDGQLHHCESGVTADTRFRYASMTKLFTADAVLTLAREGRLQLDDQLWNWLPALPEPADERWKTITIRHLLQHEAGFDRLRSTEQLTRHRAEPWCPHDLSQLVQIKLDFTPGEKQQYSNTGYCLLGVLLEQVHGKPFRDLMTERYSLTERAMRFVDGPYEADEVVYDFRNGDFYMDSYHRLFDFQALSSSAGLSGSARALAAALHDITGNGEPHLLSAAPPPQCDRNRMFECYGYSGSYYQQAGNPLQLFIQGGLLPGVTSGAVLDSEGGITVWISAGVSPPGTRAAKDLNTRLYDRLQGMYTRVGSER